LYQKSIFIGIALLICISLYTNSILLTIFLAFSLIVLNARIAEKKEDKELRYGEPPEYHSYNRDKEYSDE